MILVISSPSNSTTGFLTLIFLNPPLLDVEAILYVCVLSAGTYRDALWTADVGRARRVARCKEAAEVSDRVLLLLVQMPRDRALLDEMRVVFMVRRSQEKSRHKYNLLAVCPV